MQDKEKVFVVEDNPKMLEALKNFLRVSGFDVEAYSSATAFLKAYNGEQWGCLVLDLKLPEMNGLELQEALLNNHIDLPVIFVSGNASVREAVTAMKRGSFEFLEKPYDPQLLLAKLKEALMLGRAARSKGLQAAQDRKRLSRLSKRERQVLALSLAGDQSKTIAHKLGIATSTVDNHRSRIMKKMGVNSSAELIKLAYLIKDED